MSSIARFYLLIVLICRILPLPLCAKRVLLKGLSFIKKFRGEWEFFICGIAMKIVGHTDYKTTANIYTHVRDEMLKKATVNMGEVFGSREKGG